MSELRINILSDEPMKELKPFKGLKYDDRFPDFENYLYNVEALLTSRWFETMKDVPEGTLLADIPGQQEARDDCHRFVYFCEKFLGYKQYPSGHPMQHQFYFAGDEQRRLADEIHHENGSDTSDNNTPTKLYDSTD